MKEKEAGISKQKPGFLLETWFLTWFRGVYVGVCGERSNYLDPGQRFKGEPLLQNTQRHGGDVLGGEVRGEVHPDEGVESPQ